MLVAACFYIAAGLLFCLPASAQTRFKVLAFYTAKEDLAHISFVGEARRFFPEIAARYHFQFDTTSNWNRLTDSVINRYDILLFLDTRPEKKEQREAFERYMRAGGGWIGFHFAGFALTPSAFNQDWDWYHNEFLGSGQYKSNTWRPTSAILKVENRHHPVTRNLPAVFKSAPNEWYRWEKDLRKNPDIEILLSIDSTSFPLGTGPKPHEIWHSGYYPVVWTNKRYRMVYLNMGHNDIDYEGGTNKELSFQFANPTQNQLVINSLLWLGRRKKHK